MGNIIASFQTVAEQALRGANLKGQTIIVTGGSSGIGLEVTRVLALAGAEVIVGAPKPERAQEAIDRIKPSAGSDPEIKVLPLDLSSFTSIHNFVQAFLADNSRLDCLVLNAAVMQTPQWLTREGFEYQTGVNYIGHVELATKLLESLMLGQDFPSRLVVVTCKLPLENPNLLQWRDMNFKSRPYSASGAYSQSKIALGVWASELSRRLNKTNVGVFIVHPGVAITRLNRFLPLFTVIYDALIAPFVKTVQQAAATTVHCCAAPKVWEHGHGKFFENCKPGRAPDVLSNQTLATKLWDKTQEIRETAQIDSHEPIDYNVGKLVFNRFHELFLGPILARFRFLASKEKAS